MAEAGHSSMTYHCQTQLSLVGGLLQRAALDGILLVQRRIILVEARVLQRVPRICIMLRSEGMGPPSQLYIMLRCPVGFYHVIPKTVRRSEGCEAPQRRDHGVLAVSHGIDSEYDAGVRALQNRN